MKAILSRCNAGGSTRRWHNAGEMSPAPPQPGNVPSSAPGEPIAATLQRALAHHQAGELAVASDLYRAVLASAPDNFDALHLLGVIAVQQGEWLEADTLLRRARAINPQSPEACSNHVVALKALERHDEALAACDAAIALNPNYVEAHHNRGVALLARQRYDEALASFDAALALRPAFAPAFADRGSALAGLGRHEAALASYDRALALQPRDPKALVRRGAALSALARHAEALDMIDRALALAPDDVDALNSRGGALTQLRRYPEAMACYDRALELRPDFAEARYNRGALRGYAGQHDAACADLAAAQARDPRLPCIDSMLLHAKLHCCDWNGFAETRERILAGLRAGERNVDPLTLMGLSDSTADQLQCARRWVSALFPRSATPLWRGERYAHSRIRIAYLSTDFREHAMPRLMAGVFEAHDRARFETTALSFGVDAPSAMRIRLTRAFDRFVDVRTMSDAEIAGWLRNEEIDIAVDLNGHTADARSGIFARRPAPIQVNYLGFPATMGADFIDYLIADRYVVPETLRHGYAEKIVYLTDCFQANDAKREIAPLTVTRQDLGLPAEGFVFCSFNSSYKLSPPQFDSWMRILAATPGSVLWLLGRSAVVEDSLRREARARGVAPERIVFAGQAPYADYLARYALADLFLDSLPFNAGTTASDALWAGLPVLTCSGEAFAARMAGSLLHAIGLPELVTATPAAYEALAVRLATDRAPHRDVRARLARHRDSFPLFDTERFRAQIEAAYVAMWQRCQRGEPPGGV